MDIPVAGHRIEEERPEPEDSDDEYEYIVALTGRGRRSTLHRRGGCWTANRLSCGSYEFLLGPDRPAAGFFGAQCKD